MEKPNYTATRDTLESLAFKGENKAWTATMRIMDTFIELEVANAIRANQSDAERAHAFHKSSPYSQPRRTGSFK